MPTQASSANSASAKKGSQQTTKKKQEKRSKIRTIIHVCDSDWGYGAAYGCMPGCTKEIPLGLIALFYNSERNIDNFRRTVPERNQPHRMFPASVVVPRGAVGLFKPSYP